MRLVWICLGSLMMIARLPAQVLYNNVDPQNLGQGDWIWEVPSCETALGVSTPAAVIDYEAAKGMQWVTVKAGDGVNEWSQWNSSLINEAHLKGMKIFAWVYAAGNDASYSGGATTEAQELAVAKWALSVGGDGLIIDAESEYEGQPAAAAAYGAGIKAAYPTRFLAYAPLPYISLHSSYPYVQFGTNCDAVMPQVYWADLGISVSNMVSDMDGEWGAWQNGLTGLNTNAIKPIIPIGQGWNSSGYVESAADLTNFVYLLKNNPSPAGRGGYHGVSYWECSQHSASVWSGLAASIILSGTNSLTVMQGSNVNFSTSLPAGGSYHYQWKLNQANIVGGTNATLAISQAQLSDAGGYAVLVTNGSGCALTYSAVLSVVSPLANQPASILAPTNMVNWWPAEGNGNDIFGTLNGTLQNGVFYTNGESGVAFHFDGTTGFLKTGASSLPPPWTVCLWVNRQNAPGSSAALFSDSSTNVLKLEQYNGTRKVGVSVSGVGDYTFNYTAPQNVWTCLAFVDNGSQVQLFANGVSQGTLALNFPLPRAYVGLDSFSQTDAIGSQTHRKFTDFMMGGLDETLIFNRALGNSEIAGIYSAGRAGLVRVPEFTAISLTNSTQMQLNLRGLTGKNITLYASTNLENWTSLGVVSDPMGAVQYLDPVPSNVQQKFYRASQP